MASEALWQIRYKDGGGEQVPGSSEDEVRGERMKFWGDREIVSIELVTK